MKNCATVLLAALLALTGVAAEGQALKQRKAGLWEIQYRGEDSASKERQQQMAERLKNMPPERRAQMDAYIKEHGVGVAAGPGGAPMTTMRVCLTPQDIAEESGQGLMKEMKQNSTCTAKVVSESASEIRIAAHCGALDAPWNDMDTRIFDVTPTHYSVEMKGHGSRGDVHIQQRAHWLGTDCKGAF